MVGVADCTRVYHGASGDVLLPTYHIPRAPPTHLWRGAPDRRRPSTNARGVEDAAPYGVCVWVGISIKPPLSAIRGGVGADVWRGRLHPRLPRRVRLASTAPRIISRGRRPRTISNGRPTLSVDRGREGVEALPYGVWGMCQRRTGVVRHPASGRRGRRPLRAVCLLHAAAYIVRAQPARLWRECIAAKARAFRRGRFMRASQHLAQEVLKPRAFGAVEDFVGRALLDELAVGEE